MTTTPTSAETRERADIAETLAAHRHFLRFTVRDLSDEQAAAHPTASQLCLGGLIKHVSAMESGWVDFILEGPSATAGGDAAVEAFLAGFQMAEGETLAGLLENYELVARRTDELLRSLPSLDIAHPLPEAPWFPKGATRSARRVFLHIIAETAQHAGHADLIRETMDGQKTMG
jgi:uncharacterized damage-inducible protein DinB